MSHVIFYPASLKSHLQRISSLRKFPQILRILERGGPDELVLNDQAEAQAIMDVGRLELLEAQLQYPFWDDDEPDFDPAHQEGFQEVHAGLYEKTASYLMTEFDIVNEI